MLSLNKYLSSKWSLRLLGASVTSILLIISFPPFNFWVLAWLALFPLLYVLSKSKNWLEAGLLGWFTGTTFYYGSCWWISYSMIHYGEISIPLAHFLTIVISSIVGLWIGLFSIVFKVFFKRNQTLGLFSVPFLWVVSEYLRLEVFGVGWNFIGYSQALHPVFIQISRFTGVYGVSFLLAGFAALLIYACNGIRQSISSLILACFLVGGVLIDGTYNITKIEKQYSHLEKIETIVVQPLVPIKCVNLECEDAFNREIELSEKGFQESTNTPSLVILPESQLSVFLDERTPEIEKIELLAKKYHAYVLFNSTRRAPNEKFFNVAALMNPNGQINEEYNKVHLLPFGEYVPLRPLLSIFGFIPIAIDAQPADKPVTISLDEYKLGTFICFESIFPSLTKDLRKAGAAAFINIANDGWFGKTAGSEQHLYHLIFRSVECQLDTARVTNTGISALILATGQINRQIKWFEPSVQNWQLHLKTGTNELTSYVIYGDIFAISCVVVSGLLFIFVSLQNFFTKC